MLCYTINNLIKFSLRIETFNGNNLTKAVRKCLNNAFLTALSLLLVYYF